MALPVIIMFSIAFICVAASWLASKAYKNIRGSNTVKLLVSLLVFLLTAGILFVAIGIILLSTFRFER